MIGNYILVTYINDNVIQESYFFMGESPSDDAEIKFHELVAGHTTEVFSDYEMRSAIEAGWLDMDEGCVCFNWLTPK